MDFVDLWRTRIIFKQFGKDHYHYIGLSSGNDFIN
ncbi:hypothetical protein LCGC14_1484300 [marine sediment metagenome]|uniref:Uncharacterized protein n=1 Tax=marine sediment metagenome TaxID=412755 RepID=A0A0F9J977_9ZZZZ